MLVVALVGATGAGLLIQLRNGKFRPVATPHLQAQDFQAQAQRRTPEPHLSENLPGRAQARGQTRETVPVAELPEPLGDTATLLQFSSAFCAPCRSTRRVLGEVAGMVPGVAHVEVDAEQHLELVRRLRVHRTPTTLVLDAAGGVVTRASGAPRKVDVIAALGKVTVTDV